MSLIPVYVRCRDAGFYRDPVLIFREGYVVFDDETPPELVLWCDAEGVHPDPVEILARRLGPNHGAVVIGEPRRSDRAHPGTDPPAFLPAVGLDLQLGRRIPHPSMHEGSVRRTSRVGECHVIDLPPHWKDPSELELLE